MKKYWFMLTALALVLCMLLSACSTPKDPNASDDSAAEKVLRISTPYGISTFLPWGSNSDGDRYVFINIYETLVEFVNSDMGMNMATDYTVSDDVVYDFNIREDAYWHTGNELFGDEKINITAQDIYDCFMLYLDADFGAVQYSNLAGTIESMEVVDTYTIRFTTKEPDAMFLKYLSDAPIFPSEAVEKDYDLNEFPVGSGAYKFVSYKVDDEVVLEKNPNYSTTIVPGADKVIFKITPDKSVAAFQLQNNEVDIALQINTTDVGTIASDPNLQLISNSTGWYRYLAFNVTKDMFKDVNVRTAISMAIDFESITNAIFSNSANLQLAVCSYGGGIPLEFDGANIDEWKKLSVYDPEGAMKLLEASGYTKGSDGIYEKDGEKLSFTIQTPANDNNRMKLGEMAATYLKNIGIDAKANAVEWATHTSDIKSGNVEMFIMGGGSTINGVSMLYHSVDSKSTSHVTGYVDTELDAEIEKAFRTVDREARKKLLEDIGIKALEARVHAGGYFEYIQAGARKTVQDFSNVNLWNPLTYPVRNVTIED